MGQKGMPFVKPTESCERWKTNKQTNADRIRAMSDAELAAAACNTGDCPPNADSIPCKQYENDELCRDCWLDWMKQEGAE